MEVMFKKCCQGNYMDMSRQSLEVRIDLKEYPPTQLFIVSLLYQGNQVCSKGQLLGDGGNSDIVCD